MNFLNRLIVSYLLICFSQMSLAAVVVAVQNQETAVPINAELGSIVQLPSPVRTITPSQYFSIQDIGSSGNEPMGKSDVRTFHVKPVRAATSEPVTFILANGRSVVLRLIPTPKADKYYDVQLEAASKRGHESKFMSVELAMMRSMLLDEVGGFARETLNETVKTDFPDMKFQLARVYASNDLTGYVFRVSNKGSGPVELNLSSLVFGSPNRAVVSQADKLKLEKCPTFGHDTAECQTALRLIIRGPKAKEPLLGSLGNSTPPFSKVPPVTSEGDVK